jgi:hypothetical protein
MSQKSINVLGVVFDCKLNWKMQAASAIKKKQTSHFTQSE